MRAPGVRGAVALGGAAGVVAGSTAMELVGVGGLLALAGRDGGVGLGPVAALAFAALPLAVVNVLGSFLLGLLLARSRHAGLDRRPALVAGLGTGFLGSFTTIATAAVFLLTPLEAGWSAIAASSGVGGFLSATAGLLLPPLALLALLAALSTAAAVLGLRLGGAPARGADAEARVDGVASDGTAADGAPAWARR